MQGNENFLILGVDRLTRTCYTLSIGRVNLNDTPVEGKIDGRHVTALEWKERDGDGTANSTAGVGRVQGEKQTCMAQLKAGGYAGADEIGSP